MLAFFGATLRGGFDIIADAVRLRDRLRGADLCLTGEGRLDASSLGGKACIGVAHVCRELSVPCVAIAGQIMDNGAIDADGALAGCYAIADRARSPRDAMDRAGELLAETSADVVRQFLRSERV
jgi:glycerate kinase